MIEVKFTFATLDEAITALAQVRAKPEAEKPAPKPAGAKASDKKTDAKSEPTVAASPAAAPATPPAESSPPSGSASISYDVIGPKISAGAKTHRAEVVALLSKYGAKSGKELKASDYAAFNTEIDALVASGDELG